MSLAFQAANIRAPQGDGVVNTNSLRFTVTNASKSNALPRDWYGKYIYIYNESAVEVEFMFSSNAAATIAAAGAATDAGTAAPTQGGRCRASGERHVRVPYVNDGQTLYFLRICGSAATLTLEGG